MAGIKDGILSIMNQLQANVPTLKHIRVWNSQLADEMQGNIYDFPKPACFVEARITNVHRPLGLGYSQSDVTFVFHLIHEQYDAGSGTFEQDLTVYDLKASVNAVLTNFQPTMCGSLMRTGELQDYNHNNIYHYQLEYITGLIDTEGVQPVTYSNTPTNMVVNGEIVYGFNVFDFTFDSTFD